MQATCADTVRQLAVGRLWGPWPSPRSLRRTETLLLLTILLHTPSCNLCLNLPVRKRLSEMLARVALGLARDGQSAVPTMTRAMSSVKLPDLPYSYGALEPYISGQIMELHHSKHHATYVANLNKALEQQAEAEHKGDVAKLISLQSAIKFNGGGALFVALSLLHGAV